ncbi:MAG: 50S ribosomal protein L25 [Bacteroidales bacterium]|nr:50S ribosomal protein L25 [Bacteroidales bacterium]
MKVIDLNATIRESLGKKAAAKLRKKGLIPVNLYGKGQNYNLCIEEKFLNKLYFTPYSYAVNIKFNNIEKKAILKEVQLHPVTDRIIHVDFYEITEDTPFEVEIPVKTVGLAKGVQLGGRLLQERKFIKVKGLLKDIPDIIEVNVEDLGLEKTIHAKDISIPGIEIIERPDEPIVSVKITRVAKEEAAQLQASQSQEQSSAQSPQSTQSSESKTKKT